MCPFTASYWIFVGFDLVLSILLIFSPFSGTTHFPCIHCSFRVPFKTNEPKLKSLEQLLLSSLLLLSSTYTFGFRFFLFGSFSIPSDDGWMEFIFGKRISMLTIWQCSQFLPLSSSSFQHQLTNNKRYSSSIFNLMHIPMSSSFISFFFASNKMIAIHQMNKTFPISYSFPSFCSSHAFQHERTSEWMNERNNLFHHSAFKVLPCTITCTYTLIWKLLLAPQQLSLNISFYTFVKFM